jgi:hypothetical protein
METNLLERLLKEHQKTNKMLEEVIKLFRQYDESYSMMIEQEGFIKSPKT